MFSSTRAWFVKPARPPLYSTLVASSGDADSMAEKSVGTPEHVGAKAAALLNPGLEMSSAARNLISMIPALLSCFMHVVKLLLDVGALRPIRHVRDAFAELMLSVPQVFAMLSPAVIRRRRLTVPGCG